MSNNMSTSLFDFDGKYWAYNQNIGKIKPITPSDYQSLTRMQNTKVSDLPNNLPQEIKAFVQSPKNREKAIRNSTWLEVLFVTDHTCNLNCGYCFESHRHTNTHAGFDEKTVRKALDFLFDGPYRKYRNFIFGFLTMGEPLTHFDSMQTIVRLVKRNAYIRRKYYNFYLGTNGTLLSHKILQFLNKNQFMLNISMDGPQEIHDAHRPLRSGAGSYELITPWIQNIQESGLYPNLKHNLWSVSVLTSKSYDWAEILKHNYQIGLPRGIFKIARQTPENPLGLNAETLPHFKNETRKLFKFFATELKQGRSKYLEMCLNRGDAMTSMLFKLLSYIPYDQCMGNNSVLITTSGDLYPCLALACKPDYCMGNITSNKIRNTACVNGKQITGFEKCLTCWCREICGGSCKHAHGIVEPDGTLREAYCQLRQLIAYECIKLATMPEINNLQLDITKI